MLRAPLRARSLLLAVSLLVTSSVGSAVATEDPEAAVQALFDAVSSRDLTDLDGLVCTDQQEWCGPTLATRRWASTSWPRASAP